MSRAVILNVGMFYERDKGTVVVQYSSSWSRHVRAALVGLVPVGGVTQSDVLVKTAKIPMGGIHGAGQRQVAKPNEPSLTRRLR